MYQIKSIPANIKDLSIADMTVTGYFASFDNVDFDMDSFERTAFDKTIAEWGPTGKNKIQHLYQHDARMPLAKPKLLKADEFGVYFESTFADTSYGRDALKLYEAGVINEHSVGFEILRARDDAYEGKSIQRIQEVRMWEGSTVTFGANDNTPFMGLKSMNKQELSERIGTLTKAVRNGTFTDETFHLLEIQLAQLNALITQHLPDADAPSKDTQPEIAPSEIDNLFNQFTINHLVSWK
jgi:HK97 family phage prohead protease